jgi:hypothetical protein
MCSRTLRAHKLGTGGVWLQGAARCPSGNTVWLQGRPSGNGVLALSGAMSVLCVPAPCGNGASVAVCLVL